MATRPRVPHPEQMRRFTLAAALAPCLLAVVVQSAPLPGAEPPSPALAERLESARAAAGPAPRTRHLDASGRPIYVNRLALEPSPYLLQHAYNPVNWFPWGDEAFAEARRQQRPVLLSIGYSTCHWCHVMEEESFEDLEIAEYLNRNYVAIKVDREERPDIDGVYMEAVTSLTGRGGWPMTVWLTPDRKPFYGGTYFPPRDGQRGGRPGFLTVLSSLKRAYDEEPERVAKKAATVSEALQAALAPGPDVGVPTVADIKRAIGQYLRAFDAKNGGLLRRQKFPSSLPTSLLLRAHRRTGDDHLLTIARTTLDAMRRGGIYDHVGGGFHRYTVDATWTVPHFEKMLYDNALLVLAYVDAWQVTGDPAYERVARDVLDYVARDMTAPSGTFYSATDADSDGEEGLYFIWDREQMRATVGPELADLAISAYGLDRPANFEGSHWVLRRDSDAAALGAKHGLDAAEVEERLVTIRTRLRTQRSTRIPPLRDEKQLVSWNGLMIQAFARAGLAFRDAGLVARGDAAARTLLARAHRDGRLARYLKDERPHGRGLLDDYAFLIAGLLELFEASGDWSRLDAAISLQAELDRGFFDDAAGGYYMTPSDGEQLIVREKPAVDGARPSGNALSALNLLRLYHLTTEPVYFERAEMTLRAFAGAIRERPTSYGVMLGAVDFLFDTPKEIMVVTPAGREQAEPFLRELSRVYLPNRVLAVAVQGDVDGIAATVPLLEEKRALRGKATAYVCEDRVCRRPAVEPGVFAEQIRKPARPYGADPGASP